LELDATFVIKKRHTELVRSEFPPALRAEDKMADLISTRRQVPCEKCPLRPMRVFREFSPDELAFISDFKSGELTAKAGTTLFLQGAHVAHLYTLLSGWAFRYMTLPDGRRQILNFAFPGEFLGLQGSVLNEMQHSVEILTPAVLCVFP